MPTSRCCFIAAIASVSPTARRRWRGSCRSSGSAGSAIRHAEADEAGAINEWLGAAPNATAAQGRIGCNIWLNDTAIRPPRALKDGETIDLGGKSVRYIATPHLPHCWDAGLMFEETTGTLFCSDLFAQPGEVPLFSDGDILSSGIAFEAASGSTSITPNTGRDGPQAGGAEAEAPRADARAGLHRRLRRRAQRARRLLRHAATLCLGGACR